MNKISQPLLPIDINLAPKQHYIDEVLRILKTNRQLTLHQIIADSKLTKTQTLITLSSLLKDGCVQYVIFLLLQKLFFYFKIPKISRF